MPAYNRTEKLIHRLYRKIEVLHPNQLVLEEVALKLGIKIIYWEHPSEAVLYNGKRYIALNMRLNDTQKWLDFGHELSHPLLHVGRQEKLHILFRQLQEYQANYFSYHFCVPTFMLQELKEVTVYDIMNLFNVDEVFAIRRLEMYERKMLLARSRC